MENIAENDELKDAADSEETQTTGNASKSKKDVEFARWQKYTHAYYASISIAAVVAIFFILKGQYEKQLVISQREVEKWQTMYDQQKNFYEGRITFWVGIALENVAENAKKEVLKQLNK